MIIFNLDGSTYLASLNSIHFIKEEAFKWPKSEIQQKYTWREMVVPVILQSDEHDYLFFSIQWTLMVSLAESQGMWMETRVNWMSDSDWEQLPFSNNILYYTAWKQPVSLPICRADLIFFQSHTWPLKSNLFNINCNIYAMRLHLIIWILSTQSFTGPIKSLFLFFISNLSVYQFLSPVEMQKCNRFFWELLFYTLHFDLWD